jgi:hypothetical protein
MRDVVEPVELVRTRVDRTGERHLWVRRLFMTALAAVTVVALLNVVGQRASTAQTSSAQASLSVHSPTRVRPGLLFQARITVTARVALPGAALVLGRGWFEGLTANTEEPQASSELSGPSGSVIEQIGSLKPGQTYVEYLEYQVNPTSISSRTQTVTLTSHGSPVVSLHRTLSIIP